MKQSSDHSAFSKTTLVTSLDEHQQRPLHRSHGIVCKAAQITGFKHSMPRDIRQLLSAKLLTLSWQLGQSSRLSKEVQ
jgi:hypothetical protein